MCRLADVKRFPVHRYSAVIFTVFVPLGLLGADIKSILPLTPALGAWWMLLCPVSLMNRPNQTKSTVSKFVDSLYFQRIPFSEKKLVRVNFAYLKRPTVTFVHNKFSNFIIIVMCPTERRNIAQIKSLVTAVANRKELEELSQPGSLAMVLAIQTHNIMELGKSSDGFIPLAWIGAVVC